MPSIFSLSGAVGIGAIILSIVTVAPASAEEALTGEQIRALVGGNTVEGAMEASGAYSEFYQADGTIKGKDYTGAWSIEGDAMCFQYGTDPKSCWQVLGEGNQVQWVKDGNVEGTGTVVTGNPNNF
ncbi:MAG TPA: hypothetical protein VED46_14445 [Alphaproteobacteria bacterium]|nr:hypothetical protein [Alphaproteobacteria bacterium]